MEQDVGLTYLIFNYLSWVSPRFEGDYINTPAVYQNWYLFNSSVSFNSTSRRYRVLFVHRIIKVKMLSESGKFSHAVSKQGHSHSASLASRRKRGRVYRKATKRIAIIHRNGVHEDWRERRDSPGMKMQMPGDVWFANRGTVLPFSPLLPARGSIGHWLRETLDDRWRLSSANDVAVILG